MEEKGEDKVEKDTHGDVKVLKKCPMCGGELEDIDLGTDIMLQQVCRGCSFGIIFAKGGDKGSPSVNITVYGEENMEKALERLVHAHPSGFAPQYNIAAKELLGIIRELEKEFGTASIGQIKEVAKGKGWDLPSVEIVVEILKRRAELYEPRHGHYKIV